MDRLLLKPEEAAEALGIGRSKLYELLAIGVIESVQIGACRRVPAAALADFVERLRADGGHVRTDQQKNLVERQDKG
jgi:excisionase family DNA binding protein